MAGRFKGAAQMGSAREPVPHEAAQHQADSGDEVSPAHSALEQRG
jgi:hypothetical protein